MNARNTSGVKGVYWHAGAGKWCAEIHVHGARYPLGYYADLQDAARAYAEAARRHHGGAKAAA